MCFFSVYTACAVLIFNLLLQNSYGLYEDQAGKLDWRHQYLGKVLFVNFDHTGSPGKRILVATDQNVVAGLTARTGDIAWRHLFESGEGGVINDMVVHGSAMVVVSGGGQFVRCFNPSLGNLLWEVNIEEQASTHKSKLIFLNDDTVVALTKLKLTALNIENGASRWSHVLPESETVTYGSLYLAKGGVVVVGQTPGSHVTLLTAQDSNPLTSQTVPAPWVNINTQCQVMHSQTLLCLDPYGLALHVLVTEASSDAPGGQPSFHRTLLQNIGLTSNHQPSLLACQESQEKAQGDLVGIRFGSRHVALVNVVEAGVRLVKDLSQVSSIQLVQYGEQTLLLSLRRQEEELLLRAYDVVTGSELPDMSLVINFPSHHGLPVQLHTHVFKKRDGTSGVRVVLLSEDHSIGLLQQSGKVAWFREESLSSIITMEMVDLPVSQAQQEIEEEFAQNGGGQYDVLAMFIRRFHSQFNQLKTLASQLKAKLKVPRHGHTVVEEMTEQDEESDDDRLTKEEYLTRDEFNLHKMIVAVSSSGKLFGLDGLTGKPVWRYFLPDLLPFSRFGSLSMPLLVQRTTAHFPHLPQCTVVGRHRITGQGLLFSFNPIAGTPSDGMPPGGQMLSYDVKQLTMLHVMDNHFLHPLVLLDKQDQYHVYPETATSLVEKLSSSLFLFTTDIDTGILRGYGMTHGPLHTLVANELWTVNLQKDSQVITNVVAKRGNEQVHSQGIVLGDRSVLYKYLNPNLVVVTTEGTDPTQRPSSFINVYLIDAVSGNIVFHCNHKKAKGPVRVVHSENWVIYNYWNQKWRRNEMAVLEMYEGQKQSNATVFSSLTPPPAPRVMRQAYIFPGYISQMAATITEKGITNKHILIAMETGGILEMPKALLDPRRPIIPTAENKEEGMIPYIPELPRIFEAMINYNRSIYNIRGLATAPAGLESTCLVVCYGLDMFGTRVMPSKMFDVLKEDFDYLFISLVLIGMILVSVITQKLAARKALNRAWR